MVAQSGSARAKGPVEIVLFGGKGRILQNGWPDGAMQLHQLRLMPVGDVVGRGGRDAFGLQGRGDVGPDEILAGAGPVRARFGHPAGGKFAQLDIGIDQNTRLPPRPSS